MPEGTSLTVDRSLYEHGLADNTRPLHFASYGDDVFDELLHLFDEYNLPACVMRLTEPATETHAQVVGYVVACLEPDGRQAVRLVARWEDLADLVLDETAVLDENAVADAKVKLHALMRKEFDPTRAVARLERDNRRAAHAQALLDLLIINQLLPPFDVSVAENFWSTVNHMDSRIQQRDELLVTKLPVPVLQQLRNETLFDVPTPRVGEVTSPTVPIMLVSAGLDAACRTADALKVGRSNLTIETVKRRIQSEIDQHLKKFSKEDLSEETIGIYTGGPKSRIIEKGVFRALPRED